MWARLRRLIREPRTTEAAEAVKAAEADLDAARDRDSEVKRVVAELRYHREINHFAERIRASMRGA